MPMSSKGRRFRRGKANETYVPPAIAEESEESRSGASPPVDYVTQPPKNNKGLTGKISTLFRRESKKKSRSTGREAEVDDDFIGTDEEEDETRSADARSVAGSIASTHSKRIFYSSHCDDDSDDSYESRVSKVSRASRGDGDEELSANAKTILRYRGFSTSIKSLFLDEALVCASMGCFGLILSNRTEYLLQLRNERRGTLAPRIRSSDKKRLPSRIVAYGLIITILLMFSTFIIWGFGTGHGLATDYYTGYGYYDDQYIQDDQYVSYANDDAANQVADDLAGADDDAYNYYNNRAGDDANEEGDDGGDDQGVGDDDANDYNNGGNRRQLGHDESELYVHPVYGLFKLRDCQENLWNPVLEMLRDEWYRDDPQRRAQQSYYDVVDDAATEAEYTQKQRDIGSTVRTTLLFVFLAFLGILGRRRRMRTRFYLVRARAQEDHLYYASSEVGATRRVAFEDTRENQYEGACSHTLCGCYPVDEVTAEEEDNAEEVEVTDSGIFRRKKKPHHEDSVARAFSCCMASCCGYLCKCWFQCLSVCALAQEAREIRLLLPPRYQRVDFITHQPFHEYHQNVASLRLYWMGKGDKPGGIMPHYNALSRLSRLIVVTGTLSVAAIVAALMFNPRAAFSWQDAVVLAATFLQSFLVLFIVHWIFHKSDLSLDAVIKLFAAGFLIAVPSAFFFEGLLVNVVLFGAWTLYEMLYLMLGDTFTTFIFDHWRLVWICGELFNAYVVAAITEELCKYYTFRAVEHPDLLFLTGLNRTEQDENAVDGGLVKYPFGSHQVQLHNSNRDEASVKSHRSNKSSNSKRISRFFRKKDEALLEENGESEFKDDIEDIRTHRQRAMAITTGMISVAVGLACAENFLYVFVLGGALANDKAEHHGDILEAWIVLFFRSIFPVHALAAAMQSINMIRKFVEGSHDSGHRIGVGRIILPAVILHGTFDAILLGVNVFIETAWDKYLEENEGNAGDGQPYNPVVLNIVAWLSIVGVMVAGIAWYYNENRKQRKRLIYLEQNDKLRQGPSLSDDAIIPPSPTASSFVSCRSKESQSPRELELV